MGENKFVFVLLVNEPRDFLKSWGFFIYGVYSF